jgi:hypothetical protein
MPCLYNAHPLDSLPAWLAEEEMQMRFAAWRSGMIALALAASICTAGCELDDKALAWRLVDLMDANPLP